MSSSEVRQRIEELQKAIRMDIYGTYVSNSVTMGVNRLLDAYGIFLGAAKAKHRDYSKELEKLDIQAEGYFRSLAKSGLRPFGHNVIALGVRKISEVLSFVERLDALPEETISKRLYEKLREDSESKDKVIKILSRVRGVPELNELLEKAGSVGMALDESWVLALCSVNLIEAGVNQKLGELNESTKGNFAARYKRLISAIKKKEHRDIQQLLPQALYDVRNKLDHASHANRVTPKEANKIKEIVISILDDLWASK